MVTSSTLHALLTRAQHASTPGQYSTLSVGPYDLASELVTECHTLLDSNLGLSS